MNNLLNKKAANRFNKKKAPKKSLKCSKFNEETNRREREKKKTDSVRD